MMSVDRITVGLDLIKDQLSYGNPSIQPLQFLTCNSSFADCNLLGEKLLRYLVRKNERRHNQIFMPP